MAVPSYTHDLVDWIADTDTTAWTELTNALNGGAPDEIDTESALQGTNTVSQITNTTALFSMCRLLASPVTLSAGQVFLVWHGHGVATALATYANGGLRLVVAGATVGDWKAWAVNGVDTPPFPYGKWVNNPVDPTVTADYTLGTPPTGGTSVYGVGSMGLLTQAVARGQPHVCDIIRYGRAEARFNGGEAANYAVFSGFAALNDATTARWGLIQATDGGYLWKGLMTLGYTSAVDFRDSNKTILVQDTRKVSSSFNKIEVRQATSRVDWTGITFTCLSPTTTASRGDFAVIDNADVNIEASTFNDMGTFVFLSVSTINNSTFRRCNLITQGGATFSGCTIDKTNDATRAMVASNPAAISNCTFVSSGTKHAIEITTPGTYTFAGNSFTGYATANGTTGNEVIYNNSGGAVTLNVTGSGVGTISYRNGTGATTTVASSASVVINIVDEDGNAITANSEVTVVRNSDTVILFEEDGIIDGSTTYSYSSGGGTVVYINVFNVTGYQPKTVNNYTLPSSGTTTLSIQLDTERFYANP